MGNIHTVGPSEALVISGGCFGGTGRKMIVGGWGWAWCLVTDVQTISLEVMTLNPVCESVETSEGVPVTVTGVAQCKIMREPEILKTACEQFLGKSVAHIEHVILQTLEGHLRAILGTLSVEAIYQDRDQFAQLVREVASPDVGKMGIEILSFTIKDIFDNVQYLQSLGRAQTANVKRDADIGVAEANRDAGIRSDMVELQDEEEEDEEQNPKEPKFNLAELTGTRGAATKDPSAPRNEYMTQQERQAQQEEKEQQERQARVQARREERLQQAKMELQAKQAQQDRAQQAIERQKEKDQQERQALGLTHVQLAKMQQQAMQAKQDCAQQAIDHERQREQDRAQQAQQADYEKMARDLVEAECDNKRMDAKYRADAKIADASREYQMQKASFDMEVNAKKAEAELAYELQGAKERQRIRAEEIEIDVVERKKQIDVEEKEILRKEKELMATVKRPTEATAYKTEQIAEGRRTQTVEAARADAERIRLIGGAEAAAIEAVGKAEAEKMRLKASAYKQYGDAAMLSMVLETLPKIAAEVSAPLSKTEEIVMIGDDRTTSEVSRLISQLPPAVQALTGVDLSKVLTKIPGATS